MEWIKTKDKLPPERLKVMARNPHCVAVSWVEGVTELGKPSWNHDFWEHADDFVTEWRFFTDEELENNEWRVL